MQKTITQYLIVIFLLMVYINRGLFVAATCEVENHEGKEINTVIELVMQLVCGKSNDIDEDGDSADPYNTFNFMSSFVCNNFSKTSQHNLPFKTLSKKHYVASDAIFSLSVYGQIDPPPEA